MVSPIIFPGSTQRGADSIPGSLANPGRFVGQNTEGGRQAVEGQKSQGSDSAPIRNAEDAINVLKARLSQRLDQQLEAVSASGPSRFSPPAFEAPSAEQVAQRVLGFVQQRLQSEASAGADTERLVGLLSDARAGVEQGFAEAREQIEALSMMDERLSADIDDSFNRIQSGLDDLNAQIVRPSQESVQPLAASGYQLERASESLFSFEVTTEEGDRVTVQMAEQRYAGASYETRLGEAGQAATVSIESGFSGRYAFSVEGDLNTSEREALANLFGRVEKVSNRFFDGDIQGAFRKAQDLNLGGGELASFSLSLTSTRIVSATAYESVSQQPSANAQLRPLGGLGRDLQSVAQSAFEQGVSEPSFEGLLNSLLQDIRQRQGERTGADAPANESLMDEFMRSIVQSLSPQTESQPQA